jgi:hypothetical protein
MKRTPAIAGMLALLLLAGSGHAAADGLGRLFFSPEQRAELDRQRLLAREREGQPETPPLPRLTGEVRRSSGRRTLWLDGRPQPADDRTAAARPPEDKVGPSFSAPDEVAALAPGDGRIVVHRRSERHAR